MNFKTIFKSLKHKDVLKRVFIVLGLIVIYRFLAHVPVPLGEPITFQEAVQNLITKSDFGSFLNLISGGGLTAFSILLVGLSPYITSSIVTKMSLDMGSIILTASSMSFVGLGVQPPEPSLGAMVSDGIAYLPEFWWLTVMPAAVVVLIVLGFNLLGDGLNDVLSVEEK